MIVPDPKVAECAFAVGAEHGYRDRVFELRHRDRNAYLLVPAVAVTQSIFCLRRHAGRVPRACRAPGPDIGPS